MSGPDADGVFEALRAIMVRQAGGLTVASDRPGDLSLEGGLDPGRNAPRWFGGVQTKKRYVSYHLMGVYIRPELLAGISDSLRKRMQGKSCFNFTKVDEHAFAELERLTQTCARLFADEGWLADHP